MVNERINQQIEEELQSTHHKRSRKADATLKAIASRKLEMWNDMELLQRQQWVRNDCVCCISSMLRYHDKRRCVFIVH